ncbi:MAG: GNAT family N-acetyltransferase [Candidatus Helarchaeota archaeon]|nr:GNAT family N-acetyltransferase [Candidatus Helarchaeota archaeon]
MDGTPYSLREFKEEDLSSVVDINLKCLPENYPDFFFLGIYYRYPKSFLVVLIDEKIVGYSMFRKEKGISCFGLKWVDKGHLVSIAVLHEHREKGLGQNLLLGGIHSMKFDYNAKEIILEVRVSNTSAINLYKKNSFSIVKKLSHYYKDGEDAYLMAYKY